MKDRLRYVGLDVHKLTITMAVAEQGNGEPQVLAKIPNSWPVLLRHLKRLGPLGSLVCCYEAGPTGYVLYRDMKAAGIKCLVVAPSLVPQQKGKRIKTDRRDAVKLARFLRSGDLTAVYVPDEIGEAMRDLVRARSDAKKAENVVRRQLQHFLLRHGRRYDDGRTSWTQQYMAWIRKQEFEHEAQRRVLVEYRCAVEQAGERIQRFSDDIAELVKSWSLFPLVKALQAMRGISLTAAAVIVAELGELRRFQRPTELMSYLGLVPSEHSTGDSRRQGRITRTGNSHARWVIVEAAWSYRFKAHKGRELTKRSEGVSAEVQAIAWKAQHRLHRKYRKLVSRGKNSQQAMTAVARELVGFIWAIARQEKLLADASRCEEDASQVLA